MYLEEISLDLEKGKELGMQLGCWNNIRTNLYAFFWVIPRRLEFICRRFGTLCLLHLHRQVDVNKMN
jgi:hypothetical protein